ncbi:hypothetical protein DSECCO2_574710 [anaerobic digester metagenome]
MILLQNSRRILSLNLFSYCENNPIMYADHSGHLASVVVGAIIGGVMGMVFDAIGQALAYFINHNRSLKGFTINKISIATAAVWGATSGAFMGGNLKKGMQGVVNGAINAASGIVDNIRNNKSINMTSILSNFIMGFIGGVYSGNGVGAGFFRKNIYTKGGMYIIGGVLYRSLPVINSMVLRQFAIGASRSLAGYLGPTIKNYVL